MTARSIGEIIAPIVARAEAMAGFQKMLAVCPTAASRKSLILVAFEIEIITAEDAELLVQAYGLETA